jgi:hypothetical protein
MTCRAAESGPVFLDIAFLCGIFLASIFRAKSALRAEFVLLAARIPIRRKQP